MNRYHAWYQSLLKSILLQLFMGLISLPILICWGIPFSLLSPIATLLFGPFLTLFLLLSSCIFFLELAYLPNTWLIYCLEKVTSCWIWCLQWGNHSWLIGFAYPPMIILAGMAIITLSIVHYKHMPSMEQRIGYCAFFMISMIMILSYYPYRHSTIEKIPCNNGNLILIPTKNSLTLIDPGLIAKKPSYESWISFTLLPEIIKKTGRLSIDHLVITTINQRVFDAIAFLSTKMTIKNLYVPWWTGKIPSFAWRAYVKLKKAITLSGGRTVSLSKKQHLYLSQQCTLFIEPIDQKKIHYYSATYPTLKTYGIINNKEHNW